MSSVVRHEGHGWFADLPAKFLTYLTPATLHIVASTDAPPPPVHHIRMLGVVLFVRADGTADISCHGLYVRGPVSRDVHDGDAVHVLLT